MNAKKLLYDPYNLIITGVGGQGNVMASRMIGDMLTRQGFYVTIGETFGASQRGGSVMSHLRISMTGEHSPQIPLGRAHMIVSLEPTEALRVMCQYGNPDVKVVTNTRPVQSVSVISGAQAYPELETLKQRIQLFSKESWFLDTTKEAGRLGNPIFSNVIIVGALSKTGDLPLDREAFEAVIRSRMASSKVETNLDAFEIGGQIAGV